MFSSSLHHLDYVGIHSRSPLGWDPFETAGLSIGLTRRHTRRYSKETWGNLGHHLACGPLNYSHLLPFPSGKLIDDSFWSITAISVFYKINECPLKPASSTGSGIQRPCGPLSLQLCQIKQILKVHSGGIGCALVFQTLSQHEGLRALRSHWCDEPSGLLWTQGQLLSRG